MVAEALKITTIRQQGRTTGFFYTTTSDFNQTVHPGKDLRRVRSRTVTAILTNSKRRKQSTCPRYLSSVFGPWRGCFPLSYRRPESVNRSSLSSMALTRILELNIKLSSSFHVSIPSSFQGGYILHFHWDN